MKTQNAKWKVAGSDWRESLGNNGQGCLIWTQHLSWRISDQGSMLPILISNIVFCLPESEPFWLKDSIETLSI